MPLDDSAEKTIKNALSSSSFNDLIGGPLTVCANAQAEVAQTTLKFIQAVGFNTEEVKGVEASPLEKTSMRIPSIPGE